MYTNEKERTSYNELEMLIIQWAESKKIVPNGKPEGQLRKVKEEMGELFLAHQGGQEEAIKKELGDIMIAIINYCALKDYTLVDCMKIAFDAIKNKKGYTDQDGVFHKDISRSNE